MTDKPTGQEFIEEVGFAFEQTGLPRMAGRVFACLLVAEPFHQSMEQLVTSLSASKGSISTTTRLLINLGMVERFCVPGVRHMYFRLNKDALGHILKHGLEDEIHMFRDFSERWRKQLDQHPTAREWLEEMHAMYTFLEDELPGLKERWEEKHRQLLAAQAKI